MAEFAIGFPILLLLFFGLLQLIFIYTDHIVVKYAAYKAARAYVATSDRDINKSASFDPLDGDISGPLTNDDRAHLAVAMIMTPMTFRGKPDLAPALPSWWDLSNGSQVRWPGWSGTNRSGLETLEDAWHCTNVRLIGNDRPDNPNGVRVTVEVDHDLKLIFPFVDFLFSGVQSLFGSDYDTINATLPAAFQKTYTGQKYYRVTERSVLPILSTVESKYEN